MKWNRDLYKVRRRSHGRKATKDLYWAELSFMKVPSFLPDAPAFVVSIAKMDFLIQAQCAESTLLARPPVLNREKHSSTVYPITPQMDAIMSSEKDTVCTSTA